MKTNENKKLILITEKLEISKDSDDRGNKIFNLTKEVDDAFVGIFSHFWPLNYPMQVKIEYGYYTFRIGERFGFSESFKFLESSVFYWQNNGGEQQWSLTINNMPSTMFEGNTPKSCVHLAIYEYRKNLLEKLKPLARFHRAPCDSRIAPVSD